MSNKIHDLVMLYLQQQDLSSTTLEELIDKYDQCSKEAESYCKTETKVNLVKSGL